MEESTVLEDMVLVLLYSNSWKEKVAETLSAQRSWKSYDFRLLDALEKKSYISSSHQTKSLVITEEGLEQARKLKEKMLSALAKLHD